MSCLVSDSSNRAAKDSVFGVEVCRSDIKIGICMVFARPWWPMQRRMYTSAIKRIPHGVKGLNTRSADLAEHLPRRSYAHAHVMPAAPATDTTALPVRPPGRPTAQRCRAALHLLRA